jgi:hypothetical protein
MENSLNTIFTPPNMLNNLMVADIFTKNGVQELMDVDPLQPIIIPLRFSGDWHRVGSTPHRDTVNVGMCMWDITG